MFFCFILLFLSFPMYFYCVLLVVSETFCVSNFFLYFLFAFRIYIDSIFFLFFAVIVLFGILISLFYVFGSHFYFCVISHLIFLLSIMFLFFMLCFSFSCIVFCFLPIRGVCSSLSLYFIFCFLSVCVYYIYNRRAKKTIVNS